MGFIDSFFRLCEPCVCVVAAMVSTVVFDEWAVDRGAGSTWELVYRMNLLDIKYFPLDSL